MGLMLIVWHYDDNVASRLRFFTRSGTACALKKVTRERGSNTPARYAMLHLEGLQSVWHPAFLSFGRYDVQGTKRGE